MKSRHSDRLRPASPGRELHGDGIRLSDDGDRVDLEVLDLLESPGVTQLRYRVPK